MEGLSNSDVALLADRDGGMNGNMGFFWIFALLLLGSNGFGWGGNRDTVTSAELQASQNAQTQALQMQNLGNQITNGQFQMLDAVHQQTDTLINQNNTNLINAIQGFNSLGLQVTNQTNVLSSQIQQLSAQMNQCCCDIKTQMLQDRLDEAERRNVTLQNAIDNANQSQYILGQLGRFVAWAGSGTQATAIAG